MLWTINHTNDNKMLNKKSELINKCRHLKKFLLKKKQRTIVLCVFVFLNLTNIFFGLFLDKKDKDTICLMIAFA